MNIHTTRTTTTATELAKSERTVTISRARRSAGKMLWFGLISLIGLVGIGVQLDRQGRFDPRFAVITPEYFRSDALDLLTQRAFERGNTAEANANARLLIARRPMPAEGLSLYAESLLAIGRGSEAAAALQTAAARGWRNRFVQRVVIFSALEQGTPDVAANRLVALWRIGERGDWLKVMTQRTLDSEQGIEAFENAVIDHDQHLASDFLVWASAAVAPHVVERIARRMANLHVRFDCAAYSKNIDGLVRSGNIDQAGAVWNSLCNLRKTNSLDLEFQSPDLISGPFDWRYPESPGLDRNLIRFGQGNALNYVNSEPFSQVVANRYLRLPVGSYSIQYHTREVPPNLKLKVTCIQSPKTETQAAHTLGRDKTLLFNIQENCPTQQVSLIVGLGSGEVRNINLSALNNR